MTRRVVVLCAVTVLAQFAGNGTAIAAPKPIGGKLGKPGYTVIALAASGKTTAARAPAGSFRLRPTAGVVTLQLRAPDGVYAGPVVVGRTRDGTRAIVGIRAGARLGAIAVSVRKGYASTSRRLPRRWAVTSRWARARHGVPLGAGRFGRVRSKPARGAVPGDLDRDGIPDVIDIDDDGDLVLDSLDPSATARAAQTATEQIGNHFDLEVGLDKTANANAPGVGDPQIEAALPEYGSLGIEIAPGDSAELDCGGAQQSPARPGGLAYCSSGGTGRLFEPGLPTAELPAFPGTPGGQLDPDGDGFGTLTQTPGSPAGGPPYATLHPGADSTQIGTGDVLIQWAASGVPQSQCPPAGSACVPYLSTLQYVFATVPALVSYSDGRGPAAMVSYPVASPDPLTGAGGGPGTQGNPIPVSVDPKTGDVTLTLTFWRPQRRPIPGETGYSNPPTAWTDIGGLRYQAQIAGGPSGCRQSAFSEHDPKLTETPSPEGTAARGSLLDEAADQPASPANTLTYSLDLSACLRSPTQGIHRPAPAPISFNPGEVRGFIFQAYNYNTEGSGQGGQSGDAAQWIWFKRQ